MPKSGNIKGGYIKKKKADPNADVFGQKKKKKLGKKKQAPTNQVRLSAALSVRGIFMPHQNLHAIDGVDGAGESLTAKQSSTPIVLEMSELRTQSRNLSLPDLLPQLKHYNPSFVRDALLQMRELLQQYPSLLTTQLHILVRETVPLILHNQEWDVRSALARLYQDALFPNVSIDSMRPFLSMFVVYVNSGLTHLEYDLRFFALEMLGLLLKFYGDAVCHFSAKLLPNLETAMSLNEYGYNFEGLKYKQVQTKCLVVLHQLQEYIFKNNALRLCSDNDLAHIHSHTDFEIRQSTRQQSVSWRELSADIGHEDEHAVHVMLVRPESQRMDMMQSILTRKSASKSAELTASVSAASATNTTAAAGSGGGGQTTTASKQFSTVLFEDRYYHLEHPECISMYFVHLMDSYWIKLWIEFSTASMAAQSAAMKLSGQGELPTSTLIETSQQLTVLKHLLDMMYKMLYAVEHLRSSGSASSVPDFFEKRMLSSIRKHMRHLMPYFPLQGTNALIRSEGGAALLLSSNISFLSVLSFLFGAKTAAAVGSTAEVDDDCDAIFDENDDATWEISFMKQISEIFRLNLKDLSEEDFGKVLGIMRRIALSGSGSGSGSGEQAAGAAGGVPDVLLVQLWRSLTQDVLLSSAPSRLTPSVIRSEIITQKQQLLLKFFSSVAIRSNSAAEKKLMPPEPVLVQWSQCLPRLLCHLDDSQIDLSHELLNVLIAFAKGTQASKGDMNARFAALLVPFFWDDVAQHHGLFLKLPRLEQQSHAVQLIYYFDALSPQLIKSLGKCCESPLLHADIIVQIIEVIRFQYEKQSVSALDWTPLHMSFVALLLMNFSALSAAASATTTAAKWNEFEAILNELLISLASIEKKMGGEKFQKLLIPFLSSQFNKSAQKNLYVQYGLLSVWRMVTSGGGGASPAVAAAAALDTLAVRQLSIFIENSIGKKFSQGLILAEHILAQREDLTCSLLREWLAQSDAASAALPLAALVHLYKRQSMAQVLATQKVKELSLQLLEKAEKMLATRAHAVEETKRCSEWKSLLALMYGI